MPHAHGSHTQKQHNIKIYIDHRKTKYFVFFLGGGGPTWLSSVNVPAYSVQVMLCEEFRAASLNLRHFSIPRQGTSSVWVGIVQMFTVLNLDT